MLQPGVSLHEGKETRSSSRRTVRKGGLGLTHGTGNIRTTHADSESACVKADNKKAGKRYSNGELLRTQGGRWVREEEETRVGRVPSL